MIIKIRFQLIKLLAGNLSVVCNMNFKQDGLYPRSKSILIYKNSSDREPLYYYDHTTKFANKKSEQDAKKCGENTDIWK